MKKQGKNMALLENVIDDLLAEKVLDKKYLDHPLGGNYSGFRECHVQPDWLLIYEVRRQVLVLMLYRTGTHAELFGK